MKLKPFDKELLSRVAGGQTSGQAIIAEFRVDPAEFWKRVDALCRKKWLVRDSQDTNVVRLGIEGYNEFAAKQRLGNKPKTPRKAQRAEKKEESIPVQKAGDLPSDAVELMQEAAKQARKERAKPRPSQPAALPIVPGQQVPAQQPREQVLPQVKLSEVSSSAARKEQPPEELAPPAPTAEDRCELCKSEFKLAAGDASRAIYGHCFCGAAYHQDCYASISDGDGRCVRCGKRFKKHFSREAEEAMNKVKQLFD